MHCSDVENPLKSTVNLLKSSIRCCRKWLVTFWMMFRCKQRHSESDCHVMWEGVRRTTPSSGADRKSPLWGCRGPGFESHFPVIDARACGVFSGASSIWNKHPNDDDLPGLQSLQLFLNYCGAWSFSFLSHGYDQSRECESVVVCPFIYPIECTLS